MERKHLCCNITDIGGDKTDKMDDISISPCLDVFISLPMDDQSISGMNISLNASFCSLLVSRGMLIYFCLGSTHMEMRRLSHAPHVTSSLSSMQSDWF